jgi:hypothetical protein
MRLITGCHMASSIDHLHAESKLLPVAEHLTMLCSQYLASSFRPSHPSHDVVLQPPGPRKNSQGCPLKETLSSKFLDTVSPHLSGGIMPEVSYKRAKDALHTDAVCAYLLSTGVNPVLGTKPPDVHPSEETLPRVYRPGPTPVRKMLFTDVLLILH